MILDRDHVPVLYRRSARFYEGAVWMYRLTRASRQCERAIDALRPRPGETVVDLGCGAPDRSCTGGARPRIEVGSAARNSWAAALPRRTSVQDQPGRSSAAGLLLELVPPSARRPLERHNLLYYGLHPDRELTGKTPQQPFVHCTQLGAELPHHRHIDTIRAEIPKGL